MTREEAKREILFAKREVMADSWIDKAYDMAIQALSKPEGQNGEWLANGDIHKECPFCGEDWDKYVFGEVLYTGELPKFCPNCGADMRGKQT